MANVTTDQIKRLNEFDTMAIADTVLMPVTNAAGSLGGKATMAALKTYVLGDLPDTMDDDNEVIAQAIAKLFAAIDGIKSNLKNLGETKAKCIDSEFLPKVCGAPLAIEGAGAPSVVPFFVGQRYHDTANKKCYEAFSVTNSTNDWVLLN